MAPTKTESDHIQLLLSIMEETDGKINWNEVAKKTGLYKDGKFVRQAFNTIKSKYGSASGSGTGNSTSSPVAGAAKGAGKVTPKKRGKGGDESDGATPSKKSKSEDKKLATTSGGNAKGLKEEVVDLEDDD